MMIDAPRVLEETRLAGAEHRAPAPVLHVRSSGGIFGADRIVLGLCAELGKHGYDAVLVPLVERDGSGRELAAAGAAQGVGVEALEVGWAYDLLGPARRLARLAAARGARIIHAHDYRSDLLTALARGPWKRVTTLHGWVGTSWALRLKEWLDARLVRSFDQVICVSAALAARERRHGLRRSVVIPNGIDLSPLDAAATSDPAPLRRELGIESPAPVIGAIGRLSAEKGYDTLLYAAARLIGDGRDLTVLLVGDGPEAAALRGLGDQLGLGERLCMPGLRRDAARLYPLLDVFCMPSRREGLPLALLEALAAGCAAVVTPVGGIPEVVDEVPPVAALVPPDSPEALADAIVRLLDDETVRVLLGQAGRARVAAAFSTERMTRDVAAVYDALLEGRPHGAHPARREETGRPAGDLHDAGAPGDDPEPGRSGPSPC
ncbi:MAG: glycosyltransferase [Candidatus Eiseniibacteriota bacterium]|jgi:glycosyltransferase involved in cell wall biosynthesis